MILDLVAAFAVGYFLGGIPTALLIGRLAGRDIFRVGSGNMGSMNTARNVGPVAGVAVFAIDVGKGAAAVSLGIWMAGVSGWNDPLLLALAGAVGAVVGHGWSPYVRFRGGKGLAAAFGASLPLAAWGGIATLLLLIALVLILRRSELSAVLALVAFPFVLGASLLRTGAPPEDAFAVATGFVLVSAVSIVKHVQARRARAKAGAAEPPSDA